MIIPIIGGLVYYIYDQNRYWIVSIPNVRKNQEEAES